MKQTNHEISVKFLHIYLQIHLHIRLHIRGLPFGPTVLSYEYANEYAYESLTTSPVKFCLPILGMYSFAYLKYNRLVPKWILSYPYPILFEYANEYANECANEYAKTSH